MIIKILNAAEFETQIPRLAEILIDAVDSGAGVSFMNPLLPDVAQDFWRGQISGIAAHSTFPFVAEVDGTIAGIVLLIKLGRPINRIGLMWPNFWCSRISDGAVWPQL